MEVSRRSFMTAASVAATALAAPKKPRLSSTAWP
ncbi:MAG: twin-arginine translocation signal domain-containing protein [Desulfuromonadaceae bacterium]